MGSATERLALLVTADTSQAVRAIGDFGTASGRVADTQPRLSRVGQTLTRKLTPAALGFAAAGAVMFQKFDEGADALRAAGATGDGFVESMKRVGNNVPASLGEVGTAMGELYQRTQLTGKPLEDLTQQVLELREVGQNVDVEQLTASMAKSGVAAEDMADALDTMFRVSQITGTSVEKLSTLQEQFGASLDLAGLSMEDQLLLLGQMEKSGVNTSAAMAGMTRGLRDLAAAGEDPAQALAELMEQMKNAATDAEAVAIANDVFGRSAVEVSAAVRNGTMDLGAMQAALSGNTDSIHEAAAGTRDWQEKLAMAQNKLVGILGPMGQYGMALGGIAAGIGPVLQGLGKLSTVLDQSATVGFLRGKVAATSFVGALGPAALAVGGLAAVAGIYASQQQKANQAADEFASALQAEADGAKDATVELLAHQIASANLNDDLAGTGVTARTVSEAFKGNEEAMRAVRAAAEGMGTEAKLEFLGIVQGAQAGTEKQGELNTAMEAAGAAGSAAAPGVDDLAGSEDVLAESSEKAAEQTRELRDAQLELMEATNQALYGSLDYADQQADTAEAVANLAAVQTDGVSSAEEIAQAQRDAERAVLDEAIAFAEGQAKLAELNGETMTATEQTELQRQKLEELKQKFPELGSQIDAYIQWLYRIPTSITTDVRTSGVVAGGQGGQIIRGAVGIRIPGARGQEFPLIAHGGEQVLNPDDADKWRRGQSGGGSQTIVTNVWLDGEMISRSTEEHTRKHSEGQYGIPVGVS